MKVKEEKEEEEEERTKVVTNPVNTSTTHWEEKSDFKNTLTISIQIMKELQQHNMC